MTRSYCCPGRQRGSLGLSDFSQGVFSGEEENEAVKA